LTWARQLSPERIIVVSDGVAKDELRRTLITQAAPTGLKANVVPLQKFIDIFNDPRFDKMSAIVIFETAPDLAKVIKAIPDLGIKHVNVGSMAHSEGKTLILKAVSADEADVEAFRVFKAAGFTTTFQMVPSDGPTDLYKEVASKGFSI
jgi:PTS system mannose-specific IIB component